MTTPPTPDPSAAMDERIRSFRPLIDQALIAHPQMVSDILSASISGFGGPSGLGIPTEIVSQRAVGVLCLVLAHMQDPDALFHDPNETTDGVQSGDVMQAINNTKQPGSGG